MAGRSDEQMTGAEIILKALADQGVEHTFGYPGGAGLPIYYEISSTVRVTKPTGGWKANAYLVFDYWSETDFKFAGIDVATNKVTNEIKVGQRPWDMALTPDGRKLYVANGRSNSVSVIDTGSLAVTKVIPVGELPWGVTIPQ